MLTIDASVFVSSLRAMEVSYRASQDFLEHLRRTHAAIVCPTLAITETVAAIARTSRNTASALKAGFSLDSLENLTLVPIDTTLAREAAAIAAEHFLRGSDAVYVAVAVRHRASLITWDNEMQQRGGTVVPTLTPTDWLAALGA
jgi:predicted nucleic acid-binding protein